MGVVLRGPEERSFVVPEGQILIVFFHRSDAARSFARIISPNDGIDLPAGAEATDWNIRLIRTTGSDSSGLLKRIGASGLRIEKDVERDAPVRGQINFRGSRLMVERAGAPVVSAAASNSPVRVLIVDDSKTICDLLTRLLDADPQIEVIAQIQDPLQAMDKIQTLKPDVITLDIHMPGMDGVTLLERYMPQMPTPTLMISSITMSEGPMVFRALEKGAFDYIQKPEFKNLAEVGQVIVEKVKQAALSKSRRPAAPQVSTSRLSQAMFDPRTLVCIGSSTGGTEALKAVFLRMPEHIPPTLVVQHIPPVFSRAFADRLNELCPFAVKEAQDGDAVIPDRVLIAPGGTQMEVHNARGELHVRIVDAPPMNRHKPSVDHLFFTVAKNVKDRPLIGGILTGMGADGARGLLALKEAGALTFAQDEATSIVYGMPREAAKLGAAESILPLQDVAEQIMTWARPRRAQAGNS